MIRRTAPLALIVLVLVLLPGCTFAPATVDDVAALLERTEFRLAEAAELERNEGREDAAGKLDELRAKVDAVGEKVNAALEDGELTGEEVATNLSEVLGLEGDEAAVLGSIVDGLADGELTVDDLATTGAAAIPLIPGLGGYGVLILGVLDLVRRGAAASRRRRIAEEDFRSVVGAVDEFRSNGGGSVWDEHGDAIAKSMGTRARNRVRAERDAATAERLRAEAAAIDARLVEERQT